MSDESKHTPDQPKVKGADVRRAGIAYLYIVRRTATGQTYVGITIDPKKRWGMHRWLANSGRSNQLLHRAMAKYGLDQFKFEIVACCRRWGDAAIEETVLIRQYESHVSQGGYNLTRGGEGPAGRKCSEETKRRISAARTGKPGRKITEPEKIASSERLHARWDANPDQFKAAASMGGKTRSGYKHPEETKRRMSESAFVVWSDRRSRNPLRVPQHR